MAIASLFTPVEDILAAQQQQNLLRRQAIAQQGQQFGVFAPLYQAGLQGIENAAQALFPTEDPRLRRASMIQGVLAKYGDMDMTDPTVLASMSKDFAAMGAGREAMMLAQDARTTMREQQRFNLEQQRFDLETKRFLDTQTRGQRELELRERQVLLDEVNKDPYGSIQRALALPEDNPLRQTIIAGASARIGEKNVDQHIKTLEAQRLVAQTKQAEAAVTGGQAVTQFLTTDGKGLVFKNGKYYRTDTGAEYKDKLVPNRAMTQAEALVALGASPPGTAPGTQPRSSGAKPNPADFEANVTPAATQSAGISGQQNQRFIRSKGRGNNYVYTPSPRGLTMEEWRSRDSE